MRNLNQIIKDYLLTNSLEQITADFNEVRTFTGKTQNVSDFETYLNFLEDMSKTDDLANEFYYGLLSLFREKHEAGEWKSDDDIDMNEVRSFCKDMVMSDPELLIDYGFAKNKKSLKDFDYDGLFRKYKIVIDNES